MKALLVIDLQKQFQTADSQKVIDYVNAHRQDYDIVIGTLFAGGNANFAKLNYSCHSTKADLLVDCDYVIEKNTYTPQLPLFLTTDYIIDVVGCDTDACVLATCFTLWDKEYSFNILTKYVYSTATNLNEDEILKSMRRNFGDCMK